MSTSWLRGPVVGLNLGGNLLRQLTAATVQDRLALVDQGVATMADRRPCTVNLHEGTVTINFVQARALSWYFVTDPSLQVRRRFAQRLAKLEWEERFPFVARLVWDPDGRVRRLAERNLGEVEPVLVSMEQRLGAKPSVIRDVVLEDPAVGVGATEGRVGRFVIEDFVGSRGVGDTGYIKESRGETYRAFDYEATPAAPAERPPVGYGSPASPEGPPSPPAGTANVVRENPPLYEEVIQRYTDCDFTPDPQPPASGRVHFALRVQPTNPESRPVDLRVPAGKAFSTVLVHAFSQQFTVSPEVWFVKVPRATDSDVAEFVVQAEKSGEGEVGLLVYDEFRLVGSLSVRLRGTETAQGLRLEKVGTVIFRDPAPVLPAKSNGITVQVSLTGEGRVAFHLLIPLGEGDDWQPTLFPLGRSGDALEAGDVQASLAALRTAVDEIEKNLHQPAILGAADVSEALRAIRLNLEGTGRQIAEDILSPSAGAVLARLRPGSVIHWVIRDSKLDAVPWELAWNAATGHHLNQDFVLVRVPVRNNPVHNGEAVGLASKSALPPAPDQFFYLLGDKVALAAEFPLLREVVQSVGGYKVITNFEDGSRQSFNIVQLRDQIGKMKIVHLLCHGVVEENRGLFLEIEENALGRLTPSLVRSLPLASNATVFVNACSSAAATFSVTGLTTFGWSFLRAGARAYIGSLAPVTTLLALRFAQAFFTAHLDRKLPLTQAMYEARQQFTSEVDPTWLLYTLYGDLSGETPQIP